MSEQSERTKLLADLKQRGFSSPAGIHWGNLWKLLKKFGGEDSEDKLLNPLILNGALCSDAEKYERLNQHLNWAERHGCLGHALNYLNKLDDSSWNQRPYENWSDEFPTEEFD